MKKLIAMLMVGMFASGCIAAITNHGWRNSALNAAKFDHQCKSMKIVSQSVHRYAIAGCGKQVIYLCTQNESEYRGRFITQSATATCRQSGSY